MSSGRDSLAKNDAIRAAVEKGDIARLNRLLDKLAKTERTAKEPKRHAARDSKA
jgi:uncharacterized protein HemY